jgi:hypothetical protein
VEESQDRILMLEKQKREQDQQVLVIEWRFPGVLQTLKVVMALEICKIEELMSNNFHVLLGK